MSQVITLSNGATQPIEQDSFIPIAVNLRSNKNSEVSRGSCQLLPLKDRCFVLLDAGLSETGNNIVETLKKGNTNKISNLKGIIISRLTIGHYLGLNVLLPELQSGSLEWIAMPQVSKLIGAEKKIFNVIKNEFQKQMEGGADTVDFLFGNDASEYIFNQTDGRVTTYFYSKIEGHGNENVIHLMRRKDIKNGVPPTEVVVPPVEIVIPPVEIVIPPIEVVVPATEVVFSPIKVVFSPIKVIVSPIKVVPHTTSTTTPNHVKENPAKTSSANNKVYVTYGDKEITRTSLTLLESVWAGKHNDITRRTSKKPDGKILVVLYRGGEDKSEYHDIESTLSSKTKEEQIKFLPRNHDHFTAIQNAMFEDDDDLRNCVTGSNIWTYRLFFALPHEGFANSASQWHTAMAKYFENKKFKLTWKEYVKKFHGFFPGPNEE